MFKPKPFQPLSVQEALRSFHAPCEGLHVQLVRPFRVMPRDYFSIGTSLPLGLAYLASAVEAAGYSVSVLDAQSSGFHDVSPTNDGRFITGGLDSESICEQIDPNANVIGISLMFAQEWPFHRELIKDIRKKNLNALIICGGEHSSSLPELCLREVPEIDYIVIGEGEITFLSLLHFVLNDSLESLRDLPSIAYRSISKEIVVNSGGARLKDIDNLPRPAWSLFDPSKYFSNVASLGPNTNRMLPMLATRGCPYQCTFCASPTMWSTRYVMRDPIKVVDEIAWLQEQFEVDTIDFFDLTAIVKKEWVLEFCEEMKRRQIKISWTLPAGTRSEALDKNVLTKIYESGCTYLSYAPESGSEETLKLIKKRVDLKNIFRSISHAKSIGHCVRIFIIIGFPSETLKDMFRSFVFAMKGALLGVDDIVSFIFTPYPGTELFQDLKKKKK
jgi:anaerobic magnesium-protoporphyrin IX monomethyl ester cyclase